MLQQIPEKQIAENKWSCS